VEVCYFDCESRTGRRELWKFAALTAGLGPDEGAIEVCCFDCKSRTGWRKLWKLATLTAGLGPDEGSCGSLLL
jgi:hypothetical protein